MGLTDSWKVNGSIPEECSWAKHLTLTVPDELAVTLHG